MSNDQHIRIGSVDFGYDLVGYMTLFFAWPVIAAQEVHYYYKREGIFLYRFIFLAF